MAQQYYWHRFFSHQPDLNFDNPRRAARRCCEVMRFWLDLGVDGLRLDAVPYLVEREGTNCENLPETHDVLKRAARRASTRSYPGPHAPRRGEPVARGRARRTSATATSATWRSTSRSCRACTWRCAQEDRHPIVEIMAQTPAIPDDCQWAIFLRNHDELTLEMVTDEERDYMYREYAADPAACASTSASGAGSRR